MKHVVARWRRSSYCANGACLEMAWTASSYCANGSCLEARCDHGVVSVRDNKLGGGADSPILGYSAESWRAFLAGVKAGDFSA